MATSTIASTKLRLPSVAVVPRGKPKSGRVWKNPGKKSFSAVAVPPLKTSWKKREIERADKKALRLFEQELKDAALNERKERRKRVEENKKRKEENLKKGEVVQKITNLAKLKRLNKKQLRKIEKR